MALFVRIVSSNTCPRCKTYIKRLQDERFEFSIYDADDPKNEKQLDEWQIDIMPVIQIVDKQGVVWFQYPPGGISPKFIKNKIAQLESK